MSMQPEELKGRIKGVLALVMTPFDDNENLDENALRKNVRFLVDKLKGEDGILIPTGSTGEFYAMTDEECKRVARIVVEEANGAMPVIVGTGRAGTRPAIEMSQYAQDVGADGVMVVLPYYHLTTEEGIYRHFKRIADAIDIGIMVYNNPVTSKMWINVELMKRLAKIPNIVADKENTPNVAEYYWMRKAIDPKDMVIVCGPGEMLFQFEAVYECPGYVTVLPNFAPDLAIAISKAAQAKDFNKLVELMNKLERFNAFLGKVARSHGPVPSTLGPKLTIPDLPVYQSITKEAMNLIGLSGGRVRDPMDNITSDEKAELKSILQELGVL